MKKGRKERKRGLGDRTGTKNTPAGIDYQFRPVECIGMSVVEYFCKTEKTKKVC